MRERRDNWIESICLRERIAWVQLGTAGVCLVLLGSSLRWFTPDAATIDAARAKDIISILVLVLVAVHLVLAIYSIADRRMRRDLLVLDDRELIIGSRGAGLALVTIATCLVGIIVTGLLGASGPLVALELLAALLAGEGVRAAVQIRLFHAP